MFFLSYFRYFQVFMLKELGSSCSVPTAHWGYYSSQNTSYIIWSAEREELVGTKYKEKKRNCYLLDLTSLCCMQVLIYCTVPHNSVPILHVNQKFWSIKLMLLGIICNCDGFSGNMSKSMELWINVLLCCRLTSLFRLLKMV